MAAEKGQGEAMEYLLMCGGDPNLKDKVSEISDWSECAKHMKLRFTWQCKMTIF